MASQWASYDNKATVFLLKMIILVGFANSLCQATETNVQSDVGVLLAWKKQLDDKYGNLNNWAESDSTPCLWTGIVCAKSTFEVLEISLVRLNLSGTLFPALDQLQKLESLDLTENNFSGSIPVEVGTMNTLTTLNLGGNQLTGSIPPQLGHLENLKRLHLGRNMLTGDIPPEFGLLHMLGYLNLASNNLTGNIPKSLVSLPRLRQLWLFSNSLYGAIPAQIENANELTRLDLSKNSLQGIIPLEICTVRNLKTLDLSKNFLMGSIPGCLAFLSHLENLNLSSNLLRHSIPKSLGVTAKLSSLDLSRNSLVSSIPPSLCSLGGLSVLVLSSNYLTGPIPVSLASCNSLQQLSISSNFLSGTLPGGIGTLPLLRYLDLSSSGLSGTLRAVNFEDKTNLLMDLSHNSFSGDIQTELGSCKILTVLSLGGNNFSGEIPREIGSCKLLQKLNLSSNALTGSIPMEFTALHNLLDLDLSYNQLNGGIPTQIGNLFSLEDLNLSHNNLSGPVPVNGVFQTITNISLEDNPKLCGGLSRLRLPSCGVHHPGRTKILIGVLLGGFVLLFGGIWLSRPRENFQDMEGQPFSERVLESGARGGDEGGIRAPFEVEGSPVTEQGQELVELQRGQAQSEHEEETTRLSDYEGTRQDPLPVYQGEGSRVCRLQTSLIPPEFNGYPCWPWSIHKFENMDLSPEEVVHTCSLANNLIFDTWSGEAYVGITPEGYRYVVERLHIPGRARSLPKILKMLGRYNHPNVLPMIGYCLGSDQSLVAVLHRHMVGRNLATALKETKLSQPGAWKVRLEIALGIVSGLQYLHEYQSADDPSPHCEIKSSRILLDENNQARVAFKIHTPELDSHNELARTIAPERVQYSSTCLQDGTDVYNVGVVLLELLSGRQALYAEGRPIVTWYNECLSLNLSIENMIDPSLQDRTQESLHQMGKMFLLAKSCVKLPLGSGPSLHTVQQYMLDQDDRVFLLP